MTTDQADAGIWDVLSDQSRREIFLRLAEGPLAVGELASDLPISRPAVSQHLRVLKTAGLVTDEAVGRRRVYRLDPIAVTAFRDQLDTFWSRALANFRDTATERSSKNTTQEDL